MTPIFMSGAGSEGDCLRCCIASIMDLPRDAVPDFRADSAYLQDIEVDKFLENLGMCRFTTWYNGDTDLQVVLDTVGRTNDKVYYMLSGGAGEGYNHVAVCYGTEIVHDPSGHNEAIDRPLPDAGLWRISVIAYRGGMPPRKARSSIRAVAKGS